jgi:hypothetical protein
MHPHNHPNLGGIESGSRKQCHSKELKLRSPETQIEALIRKHDFSIRGFHVLDLLLSVLGNSRSIPDIGIGLDPCHKGDKKDT